MKKISDATHTEGYQNIGNKKIRYMVYKNIF